MIKTIPVDQARLFFDDSLRLGSKKRKKEDDNVNTSTCSQPSCARVLKLVVSISNVESVNEVEVLSMANVYSNLSDISNIPEEIHLNFNPIHVLEWKELCKELGLQLEPESLEFDIAGEFCDGSLLQVKIVEGN